MDKARTVVSLAGGLGGPGVALTRGVQVCRLGLQNDGREFNFPTLHPFCCDSNCKGINMIGPGQPGFGFNEATVLASAPQQSGVYALYNSNSWVYVGESENIQRRLLEHLRSDNLRISSARPTGFCFESVSSHQRVARQDVLIAQLGPLANQRFG